METTNLSELKSRAEEVVIRFQAASSGPEVERQLRAVANEAVAALSGMRHYNNWLIGNHIYTWKEGELTVEYFGLGPATGTWELKNVVENTALRVKVVRNFLRDLPALIDPPSFVLAGGAGALDGEEEE